MNNNIINKILNYYYFISWKNNFNIINIEYSKLYHIETDIKLNGYKYTKKNPIYCQFCSRWSDDYLPFNFRLLPNYNDNNIKRRDEIFNIFGTYYYNGKKYKLCYLHLICGFLDKSLQYIKIDGLPKNY